MIKEGKEDRRVDRKVGRGNVRDIEAKLEIKSWYNLHTFTFGSKI